MRTAATLLLLHTVKQLTLRIDEQENPPLTFPKTSPQCKDAFLLLPGISGFRLPL